MSLANNDIKQTTEVAIIKKELRFLLSTPGYSDPNAYPDRGFLIQHFFNEIKKRPGKPGGIALNDLTIVMAELREMFTLSLYVAQEKPLLKLDFLIPQNIYEFSQQALHLATNISYRALQGYKVLSNIEEYLDKLEKDSELLEIQKLITKAKKLSEELTNNKELLEQYQIHVNKNGVQFPGAPAARAALERLGFKYQPTLFNSTRFMATCCPEILNLRAPQYLFDSSLQLPGQPKENLFNIAEHLSARGIIAPLSVSEKPANEQKIDSESSLIPANKSILFAAFAGINTSVPECPQNLELIQYDPHVIANQQLEKEIYQLKTEGERLQQELYLQQSQFANNKQNISNTESSIATKQMDLTEDNDDGLVPNFNDLLCKAPKEELEKNTEFFQLLKKFGTQLQEKHDIERKQKQDIKKTLECPICFEIMGNPLMVGGCGHSVCADCFGKQDVFIDKKATAPERIQERHCPVCLERIIGHGSQNVILQEQVKKIAPKKVKRYRIMSKQELHAHALEMSCRANAFIAEYICDQLKQDVHQIYFQRGFYCTFHSAVTRTYFETIVRILSIENTVELNKETRTLAVRARMNPLTNCDHTFAAQVFNNRFTLHYVGQPFMHLLGPDGQPINPTPFYIIRDASKASLALPLPIPTATNGYEPRLQVLPPACVAAPVPHGFVPFVPMGPPLPMGPAVAGPLPMPVVVHAPVIIAPPAPAPAPATIIAPAPGPLAPPVITPAVAALKANAEVKSAIEFKQFSEECIDNLLSFPCLVPPLSVPFYSVYAAIIRHFLNEIETRPEGITLKNLLLVLSELREVQSIVSLYAKYAEQERNPLKLDVLTYQNIDALQRQGKTILFNILKRIFNAYNPSNTMEELLSRLKSAPDLPNIEIFIMNAKKLSEELEKNKAILKPYQTHIQKVGHQMPHAPALRNNIEGAGFMYQPTLFKSDHFVCVDCSAEISGLWTWETPLDSSLHKPISHSIKLMNTLEFLNGCGMFLQSNMVAPAVQQKQNVELNNISTNNKSRTLLFSSFPERNICVIERLKTHDDTLRDHELVRANWKLQIERKPLLEATDTLREKIVSLQNK